MPSIQNTSYNPNEFNIQQQPPQNNINTTYNPNEFNNQQPPPQNNTSMPSIQNTTYNPNEFNKEVRNEQSQKVNIEEMKNDFKEIRSNYTYLNLNALGIIVK